jgi:hypothetical protein
MSTQRVNWQWNGLDRATTESECDETKWKGDSKQSRRHRNNQLNDQAIQSNDAGLSVTETEFEKIPKAKSPDGRKQKESQRLSG